MPSQEQVQWWRAEIEEFRAWVKNLSDLEIPKEMVVYFHEEWKWNALADESNRRRKERRLAREARVNLARDELIQIIKEDLDAWTPFDVSEGELGTHAYPIIEGTN